MSLTDDGLPLRTFINFVNVRTQWDSRTRNNTELITWIKEQGAGSPLFSMWTWFLFGKETQETCKYVHVVHSLSHEARKVQRQRAFSVSRVWIREQELNRRRQDHREKRLRWTGEWSPHAACNSMALSQAPNPSAKLQSALGLMSGNTLIVADVT